MIAWREILIKDRNIVLSGSLFVPSSAKGLIIFAHGSGSSRFSPRNRQVSLTLINTGFGTLLFDLLSEDESADRANVFDIPLLSSRLVMATRWVQQHPHTHGIPLGYFGASTGAAAALWAAADLNTEISAVVSRGGRPDLASSKLSQVSAPTLLIVGGSDQPVIELNKTALKSLTNANLIIIPGATHLFEEPGTLEQVSHEASAWFLKYLVALNKKARRVS